MLPITHVFLFGLAPASGADAGGSPGDDDVFLLDRAMVLDTAERLSGEPRVHVTLYDPEDAGDESDIPPECARVVQHDTDAAARVEDAVRAFYDRHENGVLLVLAERNPLFSPADIDRAALLLDQEDDVVVFAASGQGDESKVALIGTKLHHPGLYVCSGVAGRALGALMAAEAMVIPVRAIRTVAGPADYAWLLHEVERELLLGHWFPRRTLTVLNRLKRHGRIPESP